MKKIFLSAMMATGVLFAMPAWSWIISLSSCDGASDIPKPEWVSKPDFSLPGNYVGVGSSKNNDSVKRRAEAESRARQALVEHIEVKVNSVNVQSTSVHNQRVQKEDFSKLTATTEEDLRGLETKARWLDGAECEEFVLMVVSEKSVEKTHQERAMRNRLAKIKGLLEAGTNRKNTPDINVRRKDFEDAQELLQDTDFSLLPDESRGIYDKQLKEAFAAIVKEISQTKDRMALFVVNPDHNLKDSVIAKMVDQLRGSEQATVRPLESCDQEEACKKVAQEKGFAKLTILFASCKKWLTPMGSLKGTLSVTKKIFDLESRKMLNDPHTRSTEVIGWSDEELDWSTAAEKVMEGLQ